MMENADFKKSFMTTEELKKYKILLAKDAGEYNRYAAENLQNYLNKTYSATLTVIRDDLSVTGPFFRLAIPVHSRIAPEILIVLYWYMMVFASL